MTDTTNGDKVFCSAPDEPHIYITLGSGVEFGISNSSMFIRQTLPCAYGNDITTTIDLGIPTRENFRRLMTNLDRLEIHMKDE